MAPFKVFKSWSSTRYQDWLQCPLKAKLKHLDKIKEPPNEAMERGSVIHSQAEKYIKGELARMPDALLHFKAEFDELKKLYKRKVPAMVVEDNWAFTAAWTQTEWDNWAECWVRIKLDCAHHVEGDILMVSDWKTGKYRKQDDDKYKEQLQLYALAAMLMMPHLKAVRVRLVYLDAHVIHPPEGYIEYDQTDIPILKKLWEKRVKPMLADRTFAPRPNALCGWCHYRKSNVENGGGQCKF